MENYVASMIYDPKTEHFVGVHKQSGPPSIIGKWNFVGGKKNEKETIFEAHRREAIEECGIDIITHCLPQTHFDLRFHEAVVRFSRFDIMPEVERPSLPSFADNGDRVEWLPAYAISKVYAYNLNWIIPLLLSEDRVVSGHIFSGKAA